jgi:hypothetical protein
MAPLPVLERNYREDPNALYLPVLGDLPLRNATAPVAHRQLRVIPSDTMVPGPAAGGHSLSALPALGLAALGLAALGLAREAGKPGR